jgi:uncharacterized protein (TIGR00255 family)
MLKSMTAFAANEKEFRELTLSCEIRSVNHRYLDLTIKLPERLRFTESSIRGLLTSKLNRGKVECLINCKKQAMRQSFSIDQEAVRSLLAATTEIEKQMPAALGFSALDILAFPGIQHDTDYDKTELNGVLAGLVSITAEQLAEVRAREGKQLGLLIRERCEKMLGLTQAATERLPVALNLQRQKLIDRISELKLQPDFDRLEQELVYLAQKLDISEELDRLATHIKEVLRVMEQAEPAGKRLDFLMQELNREANTLGSKSPDKDLTQISIELKVLIEQIREQVQNIE